MKNSGLLLSVYSIMTIKAGLFFMDNKQLISIYFEVDNVFIEIDKV